VVFADFVRRVAPVLLGMVSLSGCSWISPSKSELKLHGDASGKGITVAELEKEIQNLADRYAMGVAEACDRIRRNSPESDKGGPLLYFKLRNATSAYDVVTSSGDPLESLLDLLTLIELQNIVWMDEGLIETLSGMTDADLLAGVLRKARTEGWDLAAKALSKEQLDKVHKVIADWRARNPNVRMVSFARFSSGTGPASYSVLNDLRSGLGGLLDPMGSTNRSVEATRDVAARALFFSKRLPMLLDWEVQAAAGGIVALPEVKRLQQDVDSLTRSAAELPAEARSLLWSGVAGLALLIVTFFALLSVCRRLSLGWSRRPDVRKPPTRVLPAP
jgi:hypothetical protein